MQLRVDDFQIRSRWYSYVFVELPVTDIYLFFLISILIFSMLRIRIRCLF